MSSTLSTHNEMVSTPSLETMTGTSTGHQVHAQVLPHTLRPRCSSDLDDQSQLVGSQVGSLLAFDFCDIAPAYFCALYPNLGIVPGEEHDPTCLNPRQASS